MTKSTITSTLTSASQAASNTDWLSATGPLHIRMTNDYLFRALLQQNNYVLKGLIGSLLHLPKEQVRSVAVINPIILGEAIDEKTFFLDVLVVLNNHTHINLELQVLNEHNWPERSLSYLCRTFDNLNSGEDYAAVRPAIQIGLLDFTLFPEYPEFYSNYQFMNTKNHTVYSDKIQLYVLNLTREDLATKTDKQYHLHHWTSFFKATTWEELKMLAKQNQFINEASATIYQLSQEELIRLQCEAREDYYRRQREVQHKLERLGVQENTIENQNLMIEKQNTRIKDQNATIEYQNAMIESKNATIQNQSTMIESKNATIQNQSTMIENQNSTIQNQSTMIENQNSTIQNQSKTIRELTDKVFSQEKKMAFQQEEIDSLKKLISDFMDSNKPSSK